MPITYDVRKRAKAHDWNKPELWRITIAPEGLYYAWENGETRYNWSAVGEIYETVGYLVVNLEKGFFLLPKRAFANENPREWLQLQEQYKSGTAKNSIGQTAGWYHDRYSVEAAQTEASACQTVR